MSLQDPEFDQFKRAFKAENFDSALQSLKRLLARYPQSFALRWHHVRVLEKLERFAEARVALNKVIELRDNFVPALIMQVQLDFHEYERNAEEDEFDAEPIQKQQARFDAIEERLFKILSIDPNAVDALHMLSGLLRGHEGNMHLAKADQLLNRAISLAPKRVDLLEDRANSFLARAIDQDEDSNNAENVVTTFSGMRYSRNILEQALADFETCYALSHQHRYGLRVGSILHDLGRFDEALATYDNVLAHVPEDDPYRPFIVERRARSENNGGGEREQMAKMLEAAVAKDGKDRGLDEDNIAHAMLSAANAVRAGKSVNDALETRLSDDPDDIMATSIAVQIINVANEPKPELVAVDPKHYPLYQQKFIAQCKDALSNLGLRHVCDAEAKGMQLMLGQSVLLSFFADEFGETGIACFSMKPKQPNLIGFLYLFFTLKWKVLAATRKTTKMVECVSQFTNGDHLSTQYESVSPFEYGPPIYIEKLPANASAAELVTLHLQRLEEYKAEYPIAKAMRAVDLESMEERWVRGQAVKRNYRAQLGYVTDTELQKLLGAFYDKFAAKVRAKIKVLAADL
ncbi:MAG TPA: tetratricopeptide repeat protein [Cellvibrio sp.]|nr:tetratricopeptide repeat protein [Cellvibrio sp.]